MSARLLPKTLFGERYVALQLPETSAGPIKAGDVIPQDRSSAAIELQKVLDDVMPLLQAVQPEKLASTLTAVSTALEGRGKQLGQTLVQLSDYLGKLNPSLPDLKADITGLANVANTYDKAAPDLLQALSDLTTTSRTIVDQRAQLSDLYATVTAASVDLTSFLQVNKDNLIRLTTAVQPTLDVLAKYAPEYPCLLRAARRRGRPGRTGVRQGHRAPRGQPGHHRVRRQPRQVPARRRRAEVRGQARPAVLPAGPEARPLAAVPAGRRDQGRLQQARAAEVPARDAARCRAAVPSAGTARSSARPTKTT